MLDSELSANVSTSRVKPTRQPRMTLRKVWSPMCGKNPLTTFSANDTEGASNVAEEQLMMADSTAPKKSTCAASGMDCMTRVGSTSWESSAMLFANLSGSSRVAAYAMNIGTKVKQK